MSLLFTLHCGRNAANTTKKAAVYTLQPLFAVSPICSNKYIPRAFGFIVLCMFPDLALITLYTFPYGNKTLQWYFIQHSFLTVAGPCRIYTCFHLSFTPQLTSVWSKEHKTFI